MDISTSTHSTGIENGVTYHMWQLPNGELHRDPDPVTNPTYYNRTFFGEFHTIYRIMEYHITRTTH